MREMTSFSQRSGAVPPPALQIDGMNDRLRIRLHDLVESELPVAVIAKRSKRETWTDFGWRACIDFFCLPDLRRRPYYVGREIDALFRSGPWYRVYELLEFAYWYRSKDFVEFCNEILEEEFSGYRFSGVKIVALTRKEDIAELDRALQNPLVEVGAHLDKALRLLSARPDPDYANAIKEAVSAVEAQTRVLAGLPHGTLGQCLKSIGERERYALHPQLQLGFTHLFGWTSDDGGVRHAQKPDLPRRISTAPDAALARYMLVTCAAFVNYLRALPEMAPEQR